MAEGQGWRQAAWTTRYEGDRRNVPEGGKCVLGRRGLDSPAATIRHFQREWPACGEKRSSSRWGGRADREQTSIRQDYSIMSMRWESPGAVGSGKGEVVARSSVERPEGHAGRRRENF